MSVSPSSSPTPVDTGSDGPRVERSAGGVVLRETDGALHVLVIRDPYRNWGLPKGHLEEGESLSEAALREVLEETGLDQVALGEELSTIDWYFRLDGVLIHKFCTFFLMRSPGGDAAPETDEGITACVWIPLDEVDERITYDNARSVVVEARQALRSGSLALPG